MPPTPGSPRRPASLGLGARITRARPDGTPTLLLAIIALILVFAVVRLARPVLMPLAVAGLLQFLLAPLVRRMRVAGIPAPLAAGVLLLGLLGLVGSGVYYLSWPALEWVEELQDEFWRIEWQFAGLKEPLEEVARASKRVDELTAVGEEDPNVVMVRPESASSLQAILSGTVGALFSALFAVFLLFFLLARDDALLRKIPVLARDAPARDRLTEAYQTVERDVSTYLLTIMAVNAVLGLMVGLALYLYGVPNPLLWGVMACFLNFIPYLGGLVGVTVILFVSILSEEVGNPYLPPITYAAINSLEGMLITPMALGHMLILSPVAIFLWLILWGWLWGIPGMLLAVPLLAVVKIVCDKVPSLHPIARLLDR